MDQGPQSVFSKGTVVSGCLTAQGVTFRSRHGANGSATWNINLWGLPAETGTAVKLTQPQDLPPCEERATPSSRLSLGFAAISRRLCNMSSLELIRLFWTGHRQIRHPGYEACMRDSGHLRGDMYNCNYGSW